MGVSLSLAHVLAGLGQGAEGAAKIIQKKRDRASASALASEKWALKKRQMEQEMKFAEDDDARKQAALKWYTRDRGGNSGGVQSLVTSPKTEVNPRWYQDFMAGREDFDKPDLPERLPDARETSDTNPMAKVYQDPSVIDMASKFYSRRSGDERALKGIEADFKAFSDAENQLKAVSVKAEKLKADYLAVKKAIEGSEYLSHPETGLIARLRQDPENKALQEELMADKTYRTLLDRSRAIKLERNKQDALEGMVGNFKRNLIQSAIKRNPALLEKLKGMLQQGATPGTRAEGLYDIREMFSPPDMSVFPKMY